LLRERAGLSQHEIADALGVTREAVALWEAGLRTPRPATASAYLAILERLAAEVTSQ
jgi:transcriptional regulator with XRE-family HTH domain